MGDHTLFFYGTLMASPVFHRVCHGTPKPEPWQTQHITIKPAILYDYRRHRVLGRDYPGLVPVDSSIENSVSGSKSNEAGSDENPRFSVRGTVVTGLRDTDIWRLDIFEGDEYEKRDVKIRILENESQISDGIEGDKLRSSILDAKETEQEIDAVTYVWTADRDILEEEEWDFQGFLRDKLHLWAG